MKVPTSFDPETARFIAREVFCKGRFERDDQEPSDFVCQAARAVDRLCDAIEAVPEHPEPCTVPPGCRVPPCCGGEPEPRYRFRVSPWLDPVVVAVTRTETTLGKALRAARMGRGFGLRELARRVGISATYLSRIETGEERRPPSEEALTALARDLAADPDELLALAGRVPADVIDILLADRTLWATLRQTAPRTRALAAANGSAS